MAFKRIVAKSEQDLKNILNDIKEWFNNSEDYEVSFSKETRKFMDPESKKIVEKQIDVINAADKVNDKRATIKFIPMVEKGEMKLEIGGEGESVVAGKISNQMKGRGTLKSYSKDKKVALKESNTIKKSELKQLIKEEINKILSEGGPFDALGSTYGAFQTPHSLTPLKKELKNGFVITNDEEWYAGSKNYLKFSKHFSQSNLYPTYDSAKNILFNEIPDNVVKEKQLKVKRFNK
jgi:hypothetical protein